MEPLRRPVTRASCRFLQLDCAQPGRGLPFAQRRIERCVLFAAQRLAREFDQVMGDEAHAEHRIEVTAPKGLGGRPPEMASIIRFDSDVEGQLEGEDRSEFQIRKCGLVPGRHDHPVAVGGIDLMREPRKQALGIVGKIPKSVRVVRSDQRAISTVAGSLPAVTYASLGVALEAVKYGVNVKLLVIDRVEAAKETVKDGRYKLRRPVLLLSKQGPNPVAEAFARFALSKEGQDIIGEVFIPYNSIGTVEAT